MLETVAPRWGDLCVVAATGPSLTVEVAEACRGQKIVAVNDAWRRMPFAEVMYACDQRWWDVHGEAVCRDFSGERWSSHSERPKNLKYETAREYQLRLVRGDDREGFSTNPALIHYGANSGFQAINLALLFGAKRIVLVGFDMRVVSNKRHFFGDHPGTLKNGCKYEHFIPHFKRAAAQLPEGVQIMNATPGSALTCFPQVKLADALA